MRFKIFVLCFSTINKIFFHSFYERFNNDLNLLFANADIEVCITEYPGACHEALLL